MIFAAEKKSMKKHNFSAGPAILPQEVLSQAADAVRDLDGSGLSLIEISHRSKAFVNIMEEACALSLELSGLENTTYRALFLQGGASTQFLMTAYNLLEKQAGYINTGSWSDKAIKEAKLEIDQIVSNDEEASFENTLVPLEFSGNKLNRISSIFFNLNAAKKCSIL